MDESFDDSDDDDSDDDDSDNDDDDSESECSDGDDDEGNHHHDDIELSPYIPPRRSERLLNRAKCNSPLLIRRLKFD